jgi:hypothetical protein
LRTIAKLSVLATTLTLSVGLVAAPSQAATTASTACPAKVKLRNISITSWSYIYSTTMSQTCNAESASWDIGDGQSAWNGTIIFSQPSWASESIYIYDSDAMGKWTLHPADAYDANFNPVPQATQYFYVKYGSRASVGGYRSGNYAYLRVHATRYSPYYGGFTAFGGRHVTFQYRFPGMSTWHYATSSTTYSDGYTPYKKVYAGKGRYWRAVVTGTSTTWGRTTAQVYG